MFFRCLGERILFCYYAWSCQSIKIGIDLSIDKSTKIGKSDLIDIDFIDQSVEVDDTRFVHRFILIFTDFIDLYWRTDICSSVHLIMKTEVMQTVNLSRIEL